jgi:hypothetical protein
MSLRTKACRAVVFVSAYALLPSAALAQKAGMPTILLGGPAALDVSRAARDAMDRLQKPGCQRVLDDFTDREGRSLRERLGSSSPVAYLASLVLRNGEFPWGRGTARHTGQRPSPPTERRSSSAAPASIRSARAPGRTPSSTRCCTRWGCARTRRARPRSAGG